ncbi:hypothetical protein MFU01_00130 [Myxococcus fulvus]|uniref:Uncharacterized protein n=1 Tax=Myxococcus fulvus TaxID=33 RepID=A0A511SSQ7_MYXFU|nr:hypothetical protein MFU01_00130 [Myxococcus fulvus]
MAATFVPRGPGGAAAERPSFADEAGDEVTGLLAPTGGRDGGADGCPVFTGTFGAGEIWVPASATAGSSSNVFGPSRRRGTGAISVPASGAASSG